MYETTATGLLIRRTSFAASLKERSHKARASVPNAILTLSLSSERVMRMGELRRVKQLEDENRKLKQLVADFSLDKHILQDVLAKKL